MKLWLPVLFILCLMFSSCNQHPANASQEVQTMDSGYIENTLGADSVILKEPIVNSLKHYFSDTSVMDSFAIEMPAGNILSNNILIKIYSSNSKELLFLDSVSPADFYGEEAYSRGSLQPDVATNDLRRGIMGMFNVDNFAEAREVEAIKNANGVQITNMIGWNEAVADSTKMIYNFSDSYSGTKYVTYSQKLKRGVVIVQVAPQEDRD